jgi:hypothetical protein
MEKSPSSEANNRLVAQVYSLVETEFTLSCSQKSVHHWTLTKTKFPVHVENQIHVIQLYPVTLPTEFCRKSENWRCNEHQLWKEAMPE